MHLPIRLFIMVSHRGSIACGRAGWYSGVGLRAFCTGTVVERKRRAKEEEIGPGRCLRKADRGSIVGVGVGKGS